jgi:hypothetical protein
VQKTLNLLTIVNKPVVVACSRHKPKYWIALSIMLAWIAQAWAAPAWAESIAVVTKDDTVLTSLTRQEVSDLFLGKRKLVVAGIPLTPVDVADEALREAFYQGVAEMSASRVNAYWARLVFSAQGRPPRKLSLVEAKSLAKKHVGVVTYLPADTAGGFKILLRLP